MEEGIVATESSLPFRALPAAALRGRGPLELLRGGATMGAGLLAARRLIQELRPQAILGTGGYVCVPLFLAAKLARVPTLIYLPDLVPGLAGRLLARIATQVAVNVAEALPVLGLRPGDPRALVVGYPLRQEFFGQDRAVCRRAFGLEAEPPVLLVYGGSRGARSINQAIARLLPDLLVRSQIIHVCGREGDEAFLRSAAEALPAHLQTRYKLYPYLDGVHTPPMVGAFGAADLAICRSGASTLAELPAAGLPAVLVPYPYVHQDENADYLVRYGVAEKVADCAMIGNGLPQEGALFRAVARLLDDEPARQRMAEQSRALSRPDAAQRLAEAMFGLAARSGG
ncbi:MAG: UDP-N-acetylglucosamine--N-acetylmuramyl-(pentapeptide) pyrophosphoryl-undecaprenol N-acetylglucosamine transferase [Candidatus Viridilinea halotolerans]|uniref:UDP-N-acetylglucosamine--N-acetylmuramyl-(Pentapeptide) pyrophosphoryl-undecaprenol N-acetylglucosamine transferase n=1 Tax=Candidatus Viridilinea halotolerans TaxID=2491704 RepID=A0A426U616_9CHLR|nr:MAG: UDP-N-acetylglucosamine--N-acetylmuramyl-(pentapeptide) pyrophosphoryl-undecaprenol N-acetylglucosamine transferase [Candidatus Viridilinea halotolerans]